MHQIERVAILWKQFGKLLLEMYSAKKVVDMWALVAKGMDQTCQNCNGNVNVYHVIHSY